MMNTTIAPVVPNSLKFTHCDSVKLCTTYRFATPSTAKNSAHARFSLSHTGDGSVSCLPIIFSIRFLLNA